MKQVANKSLSTPFTTPPPCPHEASQLVCSIVIILEREIQSQLNNLTSIDVC